MKPEISYIVSAYDRPRLLPACLWSIYGQTHQDFEVIVTDNATNDEVAKQQRKTVEAFGDKRFRYFRTAGKLKLSDSYWSAEWGAKRATGKWLCFPCDDCYYRPTFAAEMLCATLRKSLSFVECYSVFDPSMGKAMVFECNWTIKTTFLIRSELFKKLGMFRGKPAVYGAAAADRTLGEDVSKSGAVRDVVREILVVHN